MDLRKRKKDKNECLFVFPDSVSALSAISLGTTYWRVAQQRVLVAIKRRDAYFGLHI